MSEFTEVASLTEIISNANGYVGTNPYILNFILQSKFNISILRDETFLEEAKLARDFQAPIKPEHLYINHGEYITENGVQHLIDELKKKKNSNRSLISLINQNEIIQSGDKPIPSFMVVQCSIEEHDKLYFTIYFRALEISSFFKINLEEIRLISNLIIAEFSEIQEVYLTTIAFRAYKKEAINPLKKPELELLKESQLLKTLEKRAKEKLIPLLEEKKSVDSTVIDDEAFVVILRILEDAVSNIDIPVQLKSKYTKTIITSIIKISNEIKSLRSKDSHHAGLNELYDQYKTKIQELIDEIQKIN